jgi:hypothetical protein
MSKNPFRDDVVRAELADPYQPSREPEPSPKAKAPRKPYPAAMRMLQLACLIFLGYMLGHSQYRELAVGAYALFLTFCVYCLGEMAVHYSQ